MGWHDRGVPPRRRTDPAEGHAALLRWCADPATAERATVATAVRHTLELLAEQRPGHAVEVRVPPYGVVQCGPGPRHTRGTPPTVVETDPGTWLALAVGTLAWEQALTDARVSASGLRADLSGWLPVVPPATSAAGPGSVTV